MIHGSFLNADVGQIRTPINTTAANRMMLANNRLKLTARLFLALHPQLSIRVEHKSPTPKVDSCKPYRLNEFPIPSEAGDRLVTG